MLNNKRLHYLKITLVLTSLVGLLVFPQVWLSDRLYPLTPVFSFLPPISFPWDLVTLISLAVLLLIILIHKNSQPFIVVFVLLIIFFSLWDQSRWQTWLYQYVFMLAAIGLYNWREINSAHQNSALNICRLIIVGIYLWSGLHKINVAFSDQVFPWLLDPYIGWLPGVIKSWIHSWAYWVPFVEIGLAVALLFPTTRKLGLYLSLVIHVFIFGAIGPWGHNWEHNVWPWNLAMVLFVFILYWKSKINIHEIFYSASRPLVGKLILVLFLFMPILNFFNLLDAYLSADLYSGHTPHAVITLNKNSADKLPQELHQYLTKKSENTEELSIFDWSFGELQLAPYPAERIYKNTGKKVCDLTGSPADLQLIIYERSSWYQGLDMLTKFDCLELQAKSSS
jgi:hypothetical protein